MNQFYKICPESLYDENLLSIRNRISHLLEAINSHNQQVGASFNKKGIENLQDLIRQLRILPNKDRILLNILNNALMMRYIDESNIQGFKSYDEALVATLKETSRVYKWFRDVYSEELKMDSLNIDPMLNPYVRQINFFYEFQTCLFSIAQSLYKLNLSELPDDFGLSEIDVKQNTSLLSGLSNINNFEQLLNYTYHTFENIYDLSNETCEWMDYEQPNSSLETFTEQRDFFIKLIKFLEPRYKITTWDNDYSTDIIAIIRHRHDIPDDFVRELSSD